MGKKIRRKKKEQGETSLPLWFYVLVSDMQRRHSEVYAVSGGWRRSHGIAQEPVLETAR